MKIFKIDTNNKIPELVHKNNSYSHQIFCDQFLGIINDLNYLASSFSKGSFLVQKNQS